MSDPLRDQFLEIVEQRSEIGDGRFTSVRRLGQQGGSGAFSLIFTAIDSEDSTSVVLKVFHPYFRGDAYRWACFQREAALLEELGPNYRLIRQVVGLQEFTEFARTDTGISLPVTFAYYAMERAQQSVLDALMLNRVPQQKRLVLVREMCKIVQRLHRDGVVHRDLKPANFLLLRRGELVLSDLGTAKHLDESPASTTYAGLPPGDLRYTAPEILASLHDDDPTVAKGADIFALGAVFFELMSGVPLGPELYEPGFVEDLIHVMAAARRGTRKAIYDGAVSAISSARPIPSAGGYLRHVRHRFSHMPMA